MHPLTSRHLNLFPLTMREWVRYAYREIKLDYDTRTNFGLYPFLRIGTLWMVMLYLYDRTIPPAQKDNSMHRDNGWLKAQEQVRQKNLALVRSMGYSGEWGPIRKSFPKENAH